jgi:deferrochelatase/peroxidase EfeB
LIDRSAEDVEELGVGRRKDGDPLPGVPTDAVTGELNFAGVPPTMCPHHAHVRIMNRRDGTDVDRIVRRGIPYGPELGRDGEEHRGILFLSLQRTLPDFTALMGRVQWSLDPLLSQSVDWSWRQPQDSSTGLWQNGRFGQAWGSADAPISFPMADLTTVRGGEFFFLPRLTFLEDFV